MTTKTETIDELRVRPSNMGRTVACAGWLGQAKAYGLKGTTSEAAERGTKIHKQIADHLQNGSHAEDDDTPSVMRAVEFITEKSKGALAVYYERTLERDGLPGTLDVNAVFPAHEIIIDTKTGWNDPPSGMVYWQLKTYAALRNSKVPITCYWYNPDRDTFDEIAFSAEELHDDWGFIQIATERSSYSSWWKMLEATADGCRWCPCLAHCPAARATITEISTLPDLENRLVSPEVLARDLNAKVVVEKVLKALRKQVDEWMDGGGQIPGWKRVPVSGRKAIKTEALDLIKAKVEELEYDIDAKEIDEACSLTFTKLVDILVPHMGEKTKKANKEKAMDFLWALNVVAEGQPSLKLIKE